MKKIVKYLCVNAVKLKTEVLGEGSGKELQLTIKGSVVYTWKWYCLILISKFYKGPYDFNKIIKP